MALCKFLIRTEPRDLIHLKEERKHFNRRITSGDISVFDVDNKTKRNMTATEEILIEMHEEQINGML